MNNNYYGMDFGRYDFLMDGEGPCVKLSEEELKEGWHFCDNWDGLLIHPDSYEFVVCTCEHMEKFRTPERKEHHQRIKEQRQKALDSLVKLDQELGLYETSYFDNEKPSKNSGWEFGKDE